MISENSFGNSGEFKLLNFQFHISDALRDLVAFAQFKKREKHPWRSVNFSKAAGFRQQLY